MANLIPFFIYKNFIQNKFSGSFNGSVLFMDISGFTAMTEELMKHGKEGVEILSDIINKRYEKIEKFVYSYGGFISNFAGDAFFAIFPNIRNLKPLYVAYLIKKEFDNNLFEKTKFGEFSLKMKIGISYGKIKWNIIGKENRKIYYFKSNALNNAVAAEHICEPMDIIIDENYYNKIKKYKSIKLSKVKENFYKLEKIKIKNKKEKFFEYFNIDEKILKLFFPLGINEKIKTPELKEVFSVFISFKEIKNEKKLNNLIFDIVLEAEKFEGYYEEVLFGDKGSSILIFFGIPFSHENEILRCLNFLLSLKQKYNEKIKAGVTNGIVYAGLEGGNLRSDYVALGDCVNLSARLMEKAKWGEILITKEIAKKSKNICLTKFKGKIFVKGKKDLFQVFELCGAKEDSSILVKKRKFQKSFLIGREEELNKIKGIVDEFYKKNLYKIVYIFGDPGIGKSRIIYEVIKIYENDFNIISLFCEDLLKKSLNPFVSFFEEFFNQKKIKKLESKLNNFEKSFNEFLYKLKKNFIDENLIRNLIWAKDYLKAIIGIEENNSKLNNLDPKIKYENIFLSIRYFLKTLSCIKPIILIVEDIHWIDEDSKLLIKYIVDNIDKNPLLIFFTSRYNNGDLYLFDFNKDIETEIIKLEKLSNYDSICLIRSFLDGEPDKELSNFIIEKTQNIPFYIEQFCLYLQENNYLKKINDKYYLKDKLIGIPSDINFIIQGRIDTLPYLLREIAKIASVLGTRFIYDIFYEILKKINFNLTLNEFNSLLEQGVTEKLWINLNSNYEFMFIHSLLRDTLYDMQLRSRLREVHKVSAEVFEKYYKDEPSKYFDIYYHYEKGEIIDKSVYYLEKSADYFKENYKNKEASELYRKLLLYSLSEEKIIDIYCKISEIDVIFGEWDKALEKTKEALNLSLKIKDKERESNARNIYSNILWRKGEYEKALEEAFIVLKISKNNKNKMIYCSALKVIGDVYYNIGNYDDSINFLKEALNISEMMNNSKMLSDSYNSLGRVFDIKGEYEKALYYYKKSLEISEKINDKRGLSVCYNNIAIVYYEEKEYEKALEFYNKSLQISEEIGDKLGISVTLTNMGIIYYSLGDYIKTIEYLEKSLKIQKEIGAKGDYGYNLTYLACAYYKIKNYNDALKYAYEHFENINEVKIDVEYGRTHLAVALILSDISDNIEVYEDILNKISYITNLSISPEIFFEYAIKLSREVNYFETLIPSLKEYNSYLLKIGKEKEAYELLKEIKKIEENINKT